MKRDLTITLVGRRFRLSLSTETMEDHSYFTDNPREFDGLVAQIQTLFNMRQTHDGRFFRDPAHCEVCAPQEQRMERHRCDVHLKLTHDPTAPAPPVDKAISKG